MRRLSVPIVLLIAGIVCATLGNAAIALTTTIMRPLSDDIHADTSSNRADARVLDLEAFLANPQGCDGADQGMACYIDDTTAQISSHIDTSPTDDKKVVHADHSATVTIGDTPRIHLDDHVDLIRTSTFPVPDPTSATTLKLTNSEATLDSRDTVRTGIQYFFPFKTERNTYLYFDQATRASAPLDYVTKAERSGLDVYEFTQHRNDVVPLTDSLARVFLGDDAGAQGAGAQGTGTGEGDPLLAKLDEADSQRLRQLKLEGDARDFYDADALDALDLSGSERVQLTPYYQVERTVWVEPESGTILEKKEHYHLLFAGSPEDAATLRDRGNDSTLLADVAFSFDDDTLAARRAAALPVVRWERASIIVSYILKVAAAVLLITGALMLRRRHARAE